MFIYFTQFGINTPKGNDKAMLTAGKPYTAEECFGLLAIKDDGGKEILIDLEYSRYTDGPWHTLLNLEGEDVTIKDGSYGKVMRDYGEYVSVMFKKEDIKEILPF